jgi:hypothetical protein
LLTAKALLKLSCRCQSGFGFTLPGTTPFDKPADEKEDSTRHGDDNNTKTDLKLRIGQGWD